MRLYKRNRYTSDDLGVQKIGGCHKSGGMVMKKEQNIAFLMMILFLLSASIGFLHGRKKGVDAEVIADDVRVLLEQQDAIDYLQPYLLSGNIYAAAKALAEFTDPLLLKIVDTILQNKTIVLADEQKVQLLAALLMAKKDGQQQEIINRMVHYFPNYPIFVAMASQYIKMVPLLVTWAQQHNKEQLKKWVEESMQTILKRDNVELLTALYDGGVPFDLIPSSPILYQVASENKKVAFVPFLVRQLKANIRYSPDGKHTALIKAVENNNRDMVKVLLKEGADPEYMINPQIGTARQAAFERGHADLELLLKKKK